MNPCTLCGRPSCMTYYHAELCRTCWEALCDAATESRILARLHLVRDRTGEVVEAVEAASPDAPELSCNSPASDVP